MNTFLLIILAGVFCIILIFVLWRLLSRCITLPCPSWLGWLLEIENPFTHANKSTVIINHLNLESGMMVLDAGCGPGRLTIPVAKKIGPHGTVTAMDIQTKMLQRVKEKAQAEHVNNIRFLQANIGEGKLEHNKYDRILLVTVLGEIPNQKAALTELFTALKPGGILSLTEVIFDPHFQRMGSVLPLAESIGFQKKKSIGNCWAYTVQLIKPMNV